MKRLLTLCLCLGFISIANGQMSPDEALRQMREADQSRDEVQGQAGAPTTPPASSATQLYMVLKVEGEIGLDMTADILRAVLKSAKAHSVRLIVMEIDSFGGDIEGDNGEQAILKAMREAKDVQFIALVRGAYSAAATIALGCDRIVMQPGSAIGAMIPVTTGSGL
ncbi:MAG: hypothetical protein WD042_19225 [Phycisphaeraceae bacterium]